jgi:hypothetical protein
MCSRHRRKAVFWATFGMAFDDANVVQAMLNSDKPIKAVPFRLFAFRAPSLTQ